jgi:hypothetical protein
MPSISRNEVIQALAEHFTKRFNAPVHAMYDDFKRKYNVYGSNLPAHPDMRSQYPNGWSLSQDLSAAEAREIARSVKLKHLENLKVSLTTSGDAQYAQIETSTSSESVLIAPGKIPSESLKMDAGDLRKKAKKMIQQAEKMEAAARLL